MEGMGNISPEQQEIFAKLGMYEQQVRQIQQQLQAVQESIMELNSLDFGLDEIERVSKTEGKNEILAQIGRGIFVEAELKSDRLTVDVGNKKFVKKSIPETKEIIKTQMEKLDNIKKELDKGLEDINEEINRVISEAQEKERVN